MFVQSRSCSNPINLKDGVSDGLFNYDIHEEIGRGGTSIVYLATCKRGRLRNRQVALKKIIPSSSHGEVAHIASSTSLHQVLHHPSIVSLFSTFSTLHAQYHVLELCANGSLATFMQSRRPSRLSEHELRNVVKSLVDGLVYLRQELIIHRDIKASNVLLTDDFRVKLSDFGLATKLPAIDSTTSTFCGSPNYVSPEIISRCPYGVSTDIWSLGCLMVTCLLGRPAFEAPSVTQIFDNISRANYDLPETISFEARDLISGLLQVDPAHRIPLHRILSHPFFNPSLPIHRLRLSPVSPHLNAGRKPSKKCFPPRARSENENQSPVVQRVKYPRSLSKGGLLPKGAPRVGQHNILTNIENMELKNILRDEISPRIQLSALDSTRRIASAPHPERELAVKSSFPERRRAASSLQTRSSAIATPSLIADTGSLLSTRMGSDAYEHGALAAPPISHPLLHPPRPQERRDQMTSRGTSRGSTTGSIEKGSGSDGSDREFQKAALKTSGAVSDVGSPHQYNQTVGYAAVTIPIGTIRPTQLNTISLAPQTHKIAQGQLTVLPSRSLLVDFREGERRKGKRGNEVAVVSADGMIVSLFSAPHLSTPCCLVEPVAVFPVGDLPSEYWKMYNDAARIVSQLKQRIPKLILYKPEARCTLMCNGPEADIELMFPPPESFPKQGRQATTTKGPNTRIRLLDQRRSVEIARYVPPGEWVKKVVPTTSGMRCVSEDDWNRLEPAERHGLEFLAEFRRICEAVEYLEDTAGASDHAATEWAKSAQATGNSKSRSRLESLLSEIEKISDPASSPRAFGSKAERKVSSTTTTSATVVPLLNVAPRPSKFSPVIARDVEDTPRPMNTTATSRSNNWTPLSALTRRTGMSREAGSSVTTSAGSKLPQTRFMPTVGWCVRQGQHDEHYQIMFLDGASLEVNTSDGTIICVNSVGEIVEAGASELAERLKVMPLFLSLFDSDGSCVV